MTTRLRSLLLMILGRSAFFLLGGLTGWAVVAVAQDGAPGVTVSAHLLNWIISSLLLGGMGLLLMKFLSVQRSISEERTEAYKALTAMKDDLLQRFQSYEREASQERSELTEVIAKLESAVRGAYGSGGLIRDAAVAQRYRHTLNNWLWEVYAAVTEGQLILVDLAQKLGHVVTIAKVRTPPAAEMGDDGERPV